MTMVVGNNVFGNHAHHQLFEGIGDRLGRLVRDPRKTAERKHAYLVDGLLFEVDAKYIPTMALGKGTFGFVCSCLNQETGEQVAVKKIGEALRNQFSAVATLREMQILRKTRHENVIGLKDVMVSSPSEAGFRDVYLVQELMDYDLGHVIDNSVTGLSERHCRYLLFQILRGVEFLHSVNVIHRDLKPQNLLVNKNWDLKISDFGHARTLYKDESGPRNVNIGTTWYNAPEILMRRRDYEDSADMWSVGCIFAEMLTGKPIFNGNGKDDVEQVKQIFGYLGKKTDLVFVECSETRKLLEELPCSCLSESDFRRLYWEVDPVAVGLLERMLVLDPKKRISAKEALEHPYFSEMWVPLVVDPVRSSVRLEVDENPDGVDEEVVRELIWEEVLLYRPQEQEHVYSLF